MKILQFPAAFTAILLALFLSPLAHASSTLGIISVSPTGPQIINSTINATASFTDSTTTGPHQAIWDWGDGTTTGPISISAGENHTCALIVGGAVKCWGSNSFGQLGNNSTTSSSVPVSVSGLSSGVQAISADGNHTCALTTAGGVKCWGENTYGQLGNGSNSGRLVPADVSGLISGVIAISAGRQHTCGLTTGGGVKCWGYNGFGELGNGTTTDSVTPIDVSGLNSGIKAVSAGWNHTCALTVAGGVKCWGDSSWGALGNDGSFDHTLPADVTDLIVSATAVVAGYQDTCVLTTEGGVKCWGLNDNGQLGEGGTIQSSYIPLDVSGLTSGVSAIDLLNFHACALTAAGGVKCWGSNNLGQIGNGTTVDSSVPVDVTGLTNGVSKISTGGSFACAVTSVGQTKCWGYNGFGQVGDDTSEYFTGPVNVAGLTNGIVSEANGSGTVSGSHLYATAGVYTVTLTLINDSGDSSSNQYQYVVIYDPSAGFATGSGHVMSPNGALISSPSTVGTAKFGISAKYTSGNNVPTGSAGYSFSDGNFKFASTSLDWLVVTGSTAFLSGHGSINDSGTYGFLVSATDGSPDKFRIKISDAQNNVVYDNQVGSENFALPTVSISNGQIKIH